MKLQSLHYRPEHLKNSSDKHFHKGKTNHVILSLLSSLVILWYSIAVPMHLHIESAKLSAGYCWNFFSTRPFCFFLFFSFSLFPSSMIFDIYLSVNHYLHIYLIKIIEISIICINRLFLIWFGPFLYRLHYVDIEMLNFLCFLSIIYYHLLFIKRSKHFYKLVVLLNMKQIVTF